jgi:CRISPR/Cas system CSM-associated protein Csm2 small subunit
VPRGGSDFVYNVEDFGEPNPIKKVMWWDSTCVINDLMKDGSLERGPKSFYYEELEDDGRRNPKDRYDYRSNGWECCFLEEDKYVSYDSIRHAFDSSVMETTYANIIYIKDIIDSIFLKNKDKKERTMIQYNLFMAKLGSEIVQLYGRKGKELGRFYRVFKELLKKEKIVL